MTELKPCPFCGGEPRIQGHTFHEHSSTYGVVCLDCGCETRQFYPSAKEAEEAWNRRASDEQAEALPEV